jgi:hypothetical protein
MSHSTRRRPTAKHAAKNNFISTKFFADFFAELLSLSNSFRRLWSKNFTTGGASSP